VLPANASKTAVVVVADSPMKTSPVMFAVRLNHVIVPSTSPFADKPLKPDATKSVVGLTAVAALAVDKIVKNENARMVARIAQLRLMRRT
jgi:hypothetical protein